MARKTRTREHILADYSGIHFERFALECGYSVERVMHDYGIDLLMFTYNAAGELENELVSIQLKATDSPKLIKGGNTFSFSVECSDLEMWLEELMPVILILYDASQDIAYWLHIQGYFKGKAFDPTTCKTVNVHLSKTNVLNEAAVRQFAKWKNEEHKLLKELRRKR